MTPAIFGRSEKGYETWFNLLFPGYFVLLLVVIVLSVAFVWTRLHWHLWIHLDDFF